jgi:energy-coupling factor transport system permease protein
MSPSSAREALNPVAKMLLLVTFSVLVLLLNDVFYMLVVLAGVLGLKFWLRARSVFTRTVTMFSFAIFLTQILFNHSGDTVFQAAFLEVTVGGIASGVQIAAKFLCLISMSWVFVASTSASDLSAALISSGFPYRYAYLPALSMRFVPVFQFEYSIVRDSQVVRGLRLERTFSGVVRSVRYTLTPLLFIAMSKVNHLAASMTGRGFGAYKDRTLLHPRMITGWDSAVIAAGVLVAIMLFMLDRSCPLDVFSLLFD